MKLPHVAGYSEYKGLLYINGELLSNKSIDELNAMVNQLFKKEVDVEQFKENFKHALLINKDTLIAFIREKVQTNIGYSKFNLLLKGLIIFSLTLPDMDNSSLEKALDFVINQAKILSNPIIGLNKLNPASGYETNSFTLYLEPYELEINHNTGITEDRHFDELGIMQCGSLDERWARDAIKNKLQVEGDCLKFIVSDGCLSEPYVIIRGKDNSYTVVTSSNLNENIVSSLDLILKHLPLGSKVDVKKILFVNHNGNCTKYCELAIANLVYLYEKNTLSSSDLEKYENAIDIMHKQNDSTNSMKGKLFLYDAIGKITNTYKTFFELEAMQLLNSEKRGEELCSLEKNSMPSDGFGSGKKINY